MSTPLFRTGLLAVLAAIAVADARAHSALTGFDVEADRQDAALRYLILSYDVPIETKFSTFILLVGDEERRLSPAADTPGQTKRVRLAMPPLHDVRQVTLRWSILSADGHRQRGELAVPLD